MGSVGPRLVATVAAVSEPSPSLYDRVGETKLADKHFKEALRLAPDNPDISNNYAVYLCKNGRIGEGVERFSAVAAGGSPARKRRRSSLSSLALA